MSILFASNLHEIHLPVTAAQQLGELKYLQGCFHSYHNLSPDLLAAMATKSSAGITHNSTGNGSRHTGFDYPKALQFLTELNLQEPLTSKILQQLHAHLHPQGGHWRSVNLTLPRRDLVNEELKILHSQETISIAVEQLLQLFYSQTTVDPLLTVPLLALELMKIFPFLDGNRRILLLLMRYQLLASGHQVVRYIDLESEFLATERGFYRSLAQCSREGSSPVPWLSYWWVLIRRLYKRFDRQLKHASITAGRGSKTALIQRFVTQQSKPFRSTDICAAFPTISRDQIRLALRGMRDKKLIEARGKGPAAVWLKCPAVEITNR
jgi:Fic family protein|tara:strand:+ start:4727 stop:5695 length:969 start_codon:yes stop_codon:yes gene_type:complete